jgi:hypothetical protein
MSRVHTIKSAELPTYWNGTFPTPREQADSLIFWIGEHQRTPFVQAQAKRAAIAAFIGLPISRHEDAAGFAWLNDQLLPKKLYSLVPQNDNFLAFTLTFEGWDRYYELRRTVAESRTAFMAMKYGDSQLDQVVAGCFAKAVERAGFKLRALTDQQPAGIIDDQMRAAIIAARFLVADLTHGSHGAYWEAGFAEGLGKPVIYTCEQSAWNDQKTHFDTNHLVTIPWAFDNLKKAEDLLTATIRATLRAEARQSDDEQASGIVTPAGSQSH